MRTLGLTELLAVEPGHRRLESARHHQFAAHRFPPGPDGTEWFAPHPDLLAHVAVMRAAYLAPASPSRPPRRIVGTDTGGLDFPQLIADLSVMDELRQLDLTTVPTDELAAGLRCAARVRAAMPQLRGLLLRLLRDRGRTWDELSDILGVPASTLCRWGAR